MQKWEQKAAAIWHSPCAATYTVYPTLWKSHDTTPSKFHITHLLSPLTKSSATRLPLQARFLFTDTTDMLWVAADCYSHYLQVKLREIHFGFFFLFFSFLFFKQCSEAVVMVMGYKDSSSSQCAWVGRALRLGLWMCVKECGCVSCIIPRIMPWRGWRDDLLVISWIWCVFYCLLNRVLIKRLGNDLFALVKVLINPLYSSSSFCCLSVTHTEGCTHWFSQSSWHADTKYS